MALGSLFGIALAFVGLASALPNPANTSPVKRNFGPDVIYTQPCCQPNPRSYTDPPTLCGRSVLLSGSAGTLLSTWENIYAGPYNVSFPVFPIFRSDDHGQTWYNQSFVKDTQNGWGMRNQPYLYQLPVTIGKYAAGTILLAGLSVAPDLSGTKIDIYSSTDAGKTWTFVTNVATGGGYCQNCSNDQYNQGTPIWEPSISINNGVLRVHYSDSRDSAHYSQKLVHQATTDLQSWGAVTTDAIYGLHDRPGMTIVTKGSGSYWYMTYQWCSDGNGGGAPEGSCAAYIKVATDPGKFGAATGRPIKATDGNVLKYNPYNNWTPIDGLSGSSPVKTTNGTIVVNGQSDGRIWYNKNADASGPWSYLSTASGAAYSRSINIGYNQKDLLLIAGGQGNGGFQVTSTSTDVNGCTSC